MAPTSARDIAELRTMNLSSIDVLTKSLQRLKELRPEAADNPMLQDSIEAEIDTLNLEIRISMIVQTRLQAASVTVKPLSKTKAARLQTLAATIDDTIQKDTIVTATFATISSLVSTATELRDLVKSSTA